MTRTTKILLGIGLVIMLSLLFTVASRPTVIASPAQPKCAPPVVAPAPAPVKQEKDRYRLIAEAVAAHIDHKRTFDRLKNPVGIKTVDQWSQLTNEAYELSEELEDLSKDISKADLFDHEIGFTVTDVRHLRREVLQYTLVLINKVAKMDSNICLGEGRCLDKEELPGTLKMVRNDLAETE